MKLIKWVKNKHPNLIEKSHPEKDLIKLSQHNKYPFKRVNYFLNQKHIPNQKKQVFPQTPKTILKITKSYPLSL